MQGNNKFGTAIILAGGKSSRMGFDKQFLRIDDKSLMESVIETLKEEFDEIIIISNKPEEYGDYPYTILRDSLESNGPLIGIYTGLKEAKSEYSYIIGCDMPHINLDYIKYMKERIKNLDTDGIVTKLEDSMEPFNAFYSKQLVNVLEKSIDEGFRSIYRLILNLDFEYVEEADARKFSPDWLMFSNLNTQEDLKKYLENHR